MGFESSKLHQNKGHFRIVPLFSPVIDENLVERIVIGASGVRAALIPDGAANRILCPRSDHAVEEGRRIARRVDSAREHRRSRGPGTEFLHVRREFQFEFPVFGDRDAFCLALFQRDIHCVCAAHESAIAEMICNPDGNHILSGFDQLARNGVTAIQSPVSFFLRTGFADFYTVEERFIAVIDRAEVQNKILPAQSAGRLTARRNQPIPSTSTGIPPGRTAFSHLLSSKEGFFHSFALALAAGSVL